MVFTKEFFGLVPDDHGEPIVGLCRERFCVSDPVSFKLF